MMFVIAVIGYVIPVFNIIAMIIPNRYNPKIIHILLIPNNANAPKTQYNNL